ncbi:MULTISPECIES: hypothetical protein [unclassified Streptomyces]|uniref:hypothetical protein n=1 Tax=unclassified Streptomyces TaxID=2593676 RepID=UPI003316D3AF
MTCLRLRELLGAPGLAVTDIERVPAWDGADEVPDGGDGSLVLTEPWPSAPRTVWGYDQRFKDTHWSCLPGQ